MSNTNNTKTASTKQALDNSCRAVQKARWRLSLMAGNPWHPLHFYAAEVRADAARVETEHARLLATSK